MWLLQYCELSSRFLRWFSQKKIKMIELILSMCARIVEDNFAGFFFLGTPKEANVHDVSQPSDICNMHVFMLSTRIA